MATIKIKSGDQWTQIPMIGINPMPDAPSDGKTYGRKDGAWAEVATSSGSTQELTKEAIEAVFTGNVETHSHDTVYEYTEFETDVWDGTSISETLSGSGTKEDPYLIQSCADLLHLRNDSSKYQINSASEVSGVTSFEPYFKFTKSLDFNNLPITNPTSDSSSISGCFFDIDGQGATISNFNLNVPSDRTNPGIINIGFICYYHNINIDGLNVTFEVQDNGENILGILGGLYDGQYNIINNVTINGSLTLSGSLSYSLNNINIVCLSSGYVVLSQYQNLFNSLNIKSINGGFNLTINDNTTKSNGSKLEIVRAIMGHPDMNIIGYDNSYSNITNINTGGTLYDGNTAYCTMIGYYNNVDNFYINSDKAHGFVCMNDSEPPLFITSQTKTTQEIQSDEFVNELNSLVNIFRKNPDGNAPVLAPLNKAVSYDGYVKQSEFEEWKKNHSIPNDNSLKIIDIDSILNGGSNNNLKTEISINDYNMIKEATLKGYSFVFGTRASEGEACMAIYGLYQGYAYFNFGALYGFQISTGISNVDQNIGTYFEPKLHIIILAPNEDKTKAVVSETGYNINYKSLPPKYESGNMKNYLIPIYHKEFVTASQYEALGDSVNNNNVIYFIEEE